MFLQRLFSRERFFKESELMNKMGFELNNDQIYANYDLESWWKTQNKQVFEIGGGAGTGKTTCIMYFIQRIGLELDEVLFVSYMGKAVSQMIRNGLPARTIHSTCYTYEKEVSRDEKGHIIFNANGKPRMHYVPKLREKLPKKPKLIVVDEGYTIPEANAKDLMSFGIPMVVLGDPNQLPPPFGKPYFLKEPDVILHQIMRQAEGNPIIYIAQRILNDEPLLEGVYGNSAIIRRANLTDYTLRNADVIITATNRLRGEINQLFRETFLQFTDLDIPHYGEKIICRRNNWSKYIKNHGEIYLTNGLSGFVDYVDKGSYNKKSMTIDFRPDFSTRAFHNLKIDIPRLNAPLGKKSDDTWIPPDVDVFEYAYALTAHSCQGSQWDNTCVLQERNYMNSEEDYKKLLYSSVTRAINSMTFVLY